LAFATFFFEPFLLAAIFHLRSGVKGLLPIQFLGCR